MTDIWDVQSTRCDVGSNQHGEIAVVKVAEELQTLVLWHIAGQRLRMKPIRLESAFQPLRHTLGVDENHRAARLVL
ncbi:MAG TPA: hypothetical protein VGO18_01340, partial [Steroidobacteraceae bacterium]|nr:hypothetical protein [Steroidobacteraceae bacterium]